MSEPLDDLKALTAALREVGVSHYDGTVPGWPTERGAVKLVLGAEPTDTATPAAGPRTRIPRRPLSDDEMDEKLLGHFALHGEKAAAPG